jgi:hypothetical protein
LIAVKLLGDYLAMDDAELERLVAGYYRICAEAGVEPVPDDEARDKVRAMMAVLVPAFAADFRRH